MKSFLEPFFEGMEEYARRRAKIRGDEPPEDLPVGDEADGENMRDRKCQLCGDYFTEAELEVHHCN
jgi:hypothetical protein